MTESELKSYARRKAYTLVRYVDDDLDWRDILTPADFVNFYVRGSMDVDELETHLNNYHGIAA